MSRCAINLSATAVLALALAACGRSGASSDVAPPSPTTSVASVAVPAASSADAALLAAAEPFEKLTETAFSATPAELDLTIGEVRTAAAGVRSALSASAVGLLDERLAAIASARGADRRADLAIAAVEGYRVLVSAVSAAAKVPTAVNLLDYAGFRYDANLKAKPARWADMMQAMAFAREQWASIASRVTDSALRGQMDTSLTEMEGAAKRRDVPAAAAAAQRELALVDDLEKFFNAP